MRGVLGAVQRCGGGLPTRRASFRVGSGSDRARSDPLFFGMNAPLATFQLSRQPAITLLLSAVRNIFQGNFVSYFCHVWEESSVCDFPTFTTARLQYVALVLSVVRNIFQGTFVSYSCHAHTDLMCECSSYGAYLREGHYCCHTRTPAHVRM